MKKVSFAVFALLFCLLFINIQPQFAAVSSEGKGKIVERRETSTKNPSRSIVQKQTKLWQQVSEELLKSDTHGLPDPEKYLVYRLNKTALTQVLAAVPSELKKVLPETSVIMELPLPDGSFARFRIEESSVLEPDLAAKFPEIKSYRGQGVDDPTLTTRFDWTPQGFHALVLSGSQTINLEPANVGDSSLYISYYGEDLKADEIECLVEDFHDLYPQEIQRDAPQIAVGPTLRNYRIAIATTFEYAQNYGGGTVAGTVSSLNTWLNNANAVYERELSVHLNLVNDTDVIYSADRGFTTTNDPYDNSNVGSMLDVVRGDLSSNVGAENYDLGHVFGSLNGTGGSGVAYLSVVCRNFVFMQPGEIKGGGSTLVGGSVGNSTALGVWVHELGHQFGANHNFNGTLGNCSSGNHNNATSYESGSGSTIMGYSGICSGDNISGSRDMRFHAMSYAAINNYITSFASCSINTATGNSAPTISGGGNRNIPKNTPFTLTATASDPNGDSLMYTWDQIDAGGASYPQNGTSASYNDAGDPSTTTRPIFRPFPASTSASRTFPSLNYILNNANDPPDTVSGLQTAEELPRIGRTINFRVMARDNRANGGGVNEDTVTLTVDGNSGPFLVTSLNTSVSLTGGTAQTITWSVSNTNVAPVSAANVKISLSSDGGNTFPTVLAASTTNDGSESVILPNITTTSARIKVEAVGNIFFDINNTNFSITAGTGGGSYNIGGVITYGITPAGQTNKGVSGVNLSAAGTTSASALSNSSGNYQLSSLLTGNYTVTPSKSGGTGQPFSTVDASRILQAIVGLTTLTPQQLAAADSDSTGDLSTVDASNILRAIVGLPNTGTVGQWKFLPASRSYSTLSANQSNQNYDAVVVGDVDGDWMPSGGSNPIIEGNSSELLTKQSGKLFANQLVEKPSGIAAVGVSLPSNASAGTGTTTTIPITVGDTTGQGITGFNFVLNFNPTSNVIQPLADDAAISQSGTLSAGFFCIVNTTTANQLSVACTRATPISGAGTLLNLNFNVVGAAGASTPLSFSTFQFNAGTPTTTVSNGNFTVLGQTAASALVAGRLDNGKGRGVANAQVIIINSQGERLVARSNAFGYFRFADVPAGETYIITVKSKQYRFSPQVVNITQDLTNLILTAQSRE